MEPNGIHCKEEFREAQKGPFILPSSDPMPSHEPSPRAQPRILVFITLYVMPVLHCYNTPVTVHILTPRGLRGQDIHYVTFFC